MKCEDEFLWLTQQVGAASKSESSVRISEDSEFVEANSNDVVLVSLDSDSKASEVFEIFNLPSVARVLSKSDFTRIVRTLTPTSVPSVTRLSSPRPPSTGGILNGDDMLNPGGSYTSPKDRTSPGGAPYSAPGSFRLPGGMDGSIGSTGSNINGSFP